MDTFAVQLYMGDIRRCIVEFPNGKCPPPKKNSKNPYFYLP